MTDPLPVADAHQHFWNPVRNYHPWLNDEPPIAFRYGDYRAIRRPYLPEHYRADASPRQILKSVYIETEWDPRDPIGEMRYVEQLRTRTGLPTVAVAQAWLDRDDCVPVLEALQAFGFVRGIRHKPRANPSPNDPAPGGMADPRWRSGFAHLVRLGLRFDLQTPWWHLHEATRLAQDFPQARIILNHTGLPADRSEPGLAAWQAAMAGLAGCPNVAVKISGLGQGAGNWPVVQNQVIARTTIDLFGIERCMFASNFPVDSLCASFGTIYSTWENAVHDLAIGEQRALFHDNAVRLYAME